MVMHFPRNRFDYGYDSSTNATAADTTNWEIDIPTDNGTDNSYYFILPFTAEMDKDWFIPPKKKMAVIGKGKAYCKYCLKKPCESNCEAEVNDFNI